MVRHQLSSGDDGGGLVPRTAEDTAGQCAGIADQVGAGQEGAHGVTEEEIRLAGERLGSAAAQFLHVVHHMPPAVLLSQVHHGAALNNGLAVAQVVVGDNGKAMIAQKTGKGRIARAILRHAVGDLHHADDFPSNRRPLVDVDQCFSFAGREEIFRYDFHENILRSFVFISFQFILPQNHSKA